ncbi:MAG: hypothetical protein ING65_08250 [Rhodocyclaceae bacterium]|nr:hypothetical protein [Rhodocyclaceae bacterium]
MSHQALKAMLISNPNAFWDFVNAEGLTEAVVAVLDEADREAEASNAENDAELSPLIGLQVLA